MTIEKAIDRLRKISEKTPIRTNGDDLVAITMAIQALSQEPTVTSTDEPMTMVYPTIVCDDAISRKEALNCINDTWGDYSVLNEVFERIDKLPPVTQKPIECDDAISREAALEKMADYVASGYADSAEDFEEYSRIICQLPHVTQKSVLEQITAEIYEHFMTIDGGVHDTSAIKCMEIIGKYKGDKE